MSLPTTPVLGEPGHRATRLPAAGVPAPDVIHAARERWIKYRFTEVADAVDPEWLRTEAAALWPVLRPIAEPVLVEPKIADGVLVAGMRYHRVDPGRPGVPPRVKKSMLDVYERLKLQEWGAELSARVEPIIAAILDTPVRYDRVYFLLYEHDDYIAPHNDAQTGQRVNVQFPVVIGGTAGLRVLDWAWHTYYDTPGLLRILGPEVWHEVMPLAGAPDACRLNFSLRYWIRDAGDQGRTV